MHARSFLYASVLLFRSTIMLAEAEQIDPVVVVDVGDSVAATDFLVDEAPDLPLASAGKHEVAVNPIGPRARPKIHVPTIVVPAGTVNVISVSARGFAGLQSEPATSDPLR